MFKIRINGIPRDLIVAAGLWLATCVLLVLPDILFSLFVSGTGLPPSIKSWLFIFALSFLLVTSPSYKWNAFWLSFFAILQIVQFCNIKYFGVQISPYSFYLGFMEYRDVASEIFARLSSFWWIPIVIILPFGAIVYVNRKYPHKMCQHRIAYFFFVVLIIATGFRKYKEPMSWYFPNTLRFPISNAIKALCGYCLLRNNKANTEYKPYQINDLGNTGKKTIVLIIGESVNYNHMSLFGYERKTTPMLESLAKRDDVYFIKGISGGIGTFASCKFLGNVVYEPDNLRQVGLDETNLFKLAKSHGFKTFYISAQSDHAVLSIGGAQYVDVMITYETYINKFAQLSDMYLVELAKKLPYSDKNFIIVHQWCVHTPYDKHAKRSKKYDVFLQKEKVPEGKFGVMIDTGHARKEPNKDIIHLYDAAMHYNDTVVCSLFDVFNKFNDRFYIIWTSDHNEALGEGGLFGHGSGALRQETAQVPFVVQTNDKAFLMTFKEIYRPTHYEVVKMIAKELGYEIINPNEKDGVFYISGVDYTGQCGYIKFVKDLTKKAIKYEVHT